MRHRSHTHSMSYATIAYHCAMDANQVRSLAAGGETLQVEFTSDRDRFPDARLVEAVACLANGPGGVLLLGVEDDGRVTGARPRHGDRTDPRRVQAVIANLTVPPLPSEVTVVDVDDLQVIAVEVAAASTPIGTQRGVYTRRAMTTEGRPECAPYAFHEMLARAVEVGQVDHMRVPAHGLDPADLAPEEFHRFRSLSQQAGGDSAISTLDDSDLLRALGLLGPDRVLTLGAVLLFGRPEAISRFVPTHEVVFQVLRGTTVEVNHVSRLPLLAAAQEVFDRASAYNREDEIDAGLVRVAIPLIAPAALREVVANALVHRDYTRLGAVHLQLTDDDFTVTSPGGFPEGITLTNYLRESRPRSPVLADAVKRSGMVERSGRGINRMVTETIRLGRPAPDYARSSSAAVTAVFQLGSADVDLARYVLDLESRRGVPFALNDLQLMYRLREGGSLTVGEAADLWQTTPDETRAALGRMTSAGLVEHRGSGRGTRYHLSAAVYRGIGQRTAHIRVRGFDQAQHEQMVLNHVGAHGQITRSEAAELCSLTPAQASTLLRRMAAEGRLTMHGTRRGAHYSAPSPT